MMRGCYRGCPKIKKSPILDSHLRCSALNPPQRYMRWRWGDRWIDRGHRSVWYVGFVGIPPTNSAPWLGRGQKSVWPSILEPGKPLKTAKNRIYRLWFTGHWTSTARPDIPDVAVTAIFPVIPTALSHIPFGGGGRRAPFWKKIAP